MGEGRLGVRLGDEVLLALRRVAGEGVKAAVLGLAVGADLPGPELLPPVILGLAGAGRRVGVLLRRLGDRRLAGRGVAVVGLGADNRHVVAFAVGVRRPLAVDHVERRVVRAVLLRRLVGGVAGGLLVLAVLLGHGLGGVGAVLVDRVLELPDDLEAVPAAEGRQLVQVARLPLAAPLVVAGLDVGVVALDVLARQVHHPREKRRLEGEDQAVALVSLHLPVLEDRLGAHALLAHPVALSAPRAHGDVARGVAALGGPGHLVDELLSEEYVHFLLVQDELPGLGVLVNAGATQGEPADELHERGPLHLLLALGRGAQAHEDVDRGLLLRLLLGGVGTRLGDLRVGAGLGGLRGLLVLGLVLGVLGRLLRGVVGVVLDLLGEQAEHRRPLGSLLEGEGKPGEHLADEGGLGGLLIGVGHGLGVRLEVVEDVGLDGGLGLGVLGAVLGGQDIVPVGDDAGVGHGGLLGLVGLLVGGGRGLGLAHGSLLVRFALCGRACGHAVSVTKVFQDYR